MFKECSHAEPPQHVPRMIVSAEVAKQRTTDFQAEKAPILNHAINKLDHIGYSFTADVLGQLIVAIDGVVPIDETPLTGIRVYFGTFGETKNDAFDSHIPPGCKDTMMLIFAPTIAKNGDFRKDSGHYFFIDHITQRVVNISPAPGAKPEHADQWVKAFQHSTKYVGLNAYLGEGKLDTVSCWYWKQDIEDLICYMTAPHTAVNVVYVFFGSYTEGEIIEVNGKKHDVSYRTTLAIHVDCLAQYPASQIPEILHKLVLPRNSVYKTLINENGALELASHDLANETDPPGYDADTTIPCPPASCELTPSLPLP